MKAIDQAAAAREEDILNRRIYEFIEQWQPEDRREAAEFHMAFHSIVRAIYADMQRPVTACLDTVMRTQTATPFIVTNDPS